MLKGKIMLLYLTMAPEKQTVYPIMRYNKNAIVKKLRMSGEFIFCVEMKNNKISPIKM
jgi:hypothetical protein